MNPQSTSPSKSGSDAEVEQSGTRRSAAHPSAIRPGGEPFRAKIVEPIALSTREQRVAWAAEAHYNLFGLASERVIIDFLTDSGTGALSDRQWAGLFLGDESYAGSANFARLKEVVRHLFGYEYVLPTHQGRAAEHLLLKDLAAGPEGPESRVRFVIGNTHFDTTRNHIMLSGLEPVDLPVAAAADGASGHSFKGDIDVDALKQFIATKGAESVAAIIITVTNNAVGGQPVSMANLRAARQVADEHGIPLFLDAARIAENAWFIRQREPGWSHRDVKDIVRAMADEADGCVMSSKKDGLVNIGGFVAVREEARYKRLVPWVVSYEGFVTYGGLAGRDMEALARGLQEVVDHDYLAERTGQVEWFGRLLADAGVPVVQPFGGHAVYVDAGGLLPHLTAADLPGQALAVQLYIEGGLRSVEVGTVMAGRDREGNEVHPPLELLRLAIPRRVYTDDHLLYAAEVVKYVASKAEHVKGMRIVEEPAALRHFTAKFAWKD